ncbi:hypothetical protein ACSBL2_06595 [Pedobacter sp. AW31-3R]|uniref:hypothetical protein n=1 Tax=Pedobacter sp. AW31-3R TaxID=3445781 RepID=UPI003F9FED28
MDPELLKKCLSGNASDSEWELYLSWLSGSDTEESINEEELPVLPQMELAIKHRTWQKINQQNLKYEESRKRKNWLSGIAIAASLCCLGYFSFFAVRHQGSPQQTQVFKYNNSLHAVESHFNGLAIQLAKNSEVSLKTEKNAMIDVHFSGALMLSNTANEDQYIEVSTDRNQKDSSTRKMCIRKGKSYLLGYFSANHDELVLIDKQSMVDIPPALALNMRQSFNL